MRSIYLDYNATTPVAPSVFEAMRPFLTEHFGNPSSRHAIGTAAHQIVEEARFARDQARILFALERLADG